MQGNAKQVKPLLITANAAWNYLSSSLEKLLFKKDINDPDKVYIFFAKRKMKQIKAMLINIENLTLGENNYPDNFIKNLVKKIKAIINQIALITIKLDQILLK